MTPYHSRSTRRRIDIVSSAACRVRTDEVSSIVMRAQAPAVVVCAVRAALTVRAVGVPNSSGGSIAREHEAGPRADLPAPSQARPQTGDTGFDLVIEELPKHQLYQPIPVHVQPIGEEMFSASVPALALSVSGSTVVEALLLLKSAIATAYAEIEKKHKLDAAEKEQLKFYYTYIVKEPPAPEFTGNRSHGTAAASKAASRWVGRF